MKISKHSTGSDIATKKFPSRFEVDRVLDLYWGGSERRITGLTIKIVAVNVLALLALVVGLMYLGQYYNSLIEARLQTFDREMSLINVIMSESQVYNYEDSSFDETRVAQIIKDIHLDEDKQLLVFDRSGDLVVRTESSEKGRADVRERMQSYEVLTSIMQFLLGFLPDRRALPAYPNIDNVWRAEDYPNLKESLSGLSVLSAWSHEKSNIYLTATSPLLNEKGEIWGALLLTWEGHKISDDIVEVWLTVLSVFFWSLLLTVLLSIYLSGAIARPLKKLARAAENIRKGQGGAEDIPDFSHRLDEIGELSIVLKDMTAALSERMDSIEHFAADVSHELKNPLTSLRSAVETLPVVKKEADKKRLLSVVEHDINRLDRLITDISRLSRLDSELGRETLEKVNLQKMLHSLLQSYASLKGSDSNFDGWNILIEYKDTVLQVDCTRQETLYVWGVETYLMQLFDNVLSNAASFAKKSSRIYLKVSTSGSFIKIEIENEGPQIPESKLETVFDRFYSERPEHEEYGNNSGLGLSICKRVVEAHGGEIFAENVRVGVNAEAGVRFTILLNKA